MKKLSLLLVALLLLASSCPKDDPIIDIVNIPDTEYLYALINEGVDSNGDSLISYAEAEATLSLEIDGSDIFDMTGIEAFINLESLTCYRTEITHLDLSNNPKLKYLDCGNLPGRNSIPWYYVSGNLTHLDISNNPLLTTLDCSFNAFTSLDLSNNNSLKKIQIQGMPWLDTVCVWITPFPPEGVEVDTTSISSIYFTTDCSK